MLCHCYVGHDLTVGSSWSQPGPWAHFKLSSDDAILWHYVTWSGNCQDHQGDGDIGDVVAVGAAERVRGICDSDPSPSV